MTDLLTQFRAAWRVGTPLIAIRTPDQPATATHVAVGCNGKTPPPIISWDTIRGVIPMNDAGRDALANTNTEPAALINLIAALELGPKLPAKTIFFAHNVHRVINEQGVSQAVSNCRDAFKADRKVLVMLAPDLTLPAEISQDVLLLDEPLPSNSELEVIVTDTHRAADLSQPDPAGMDRAIDALCGLAAFPAEQATAMCLSKAGLDVDALWDRKRTMIESTPGLSIWRGQERFEDIGGCENVKFFLRSILTGKSAPRCIVFQDEVEKAFAGTGTDLSGVTTEMTGQILSEMQDQDYKGIIFLGHPGAAKSLTAKSAGQITGIPTIGFDLSAMKGSLVGESSARLRQALKIVRAVSQGKALFIATCNAIGNLPPELRRRYSLGTFFFDLPTAEEREQIWKLYCRKYEIGGELPDDEGWTGAEIRNCVDIAWRLDVSIKTAARFVVPIIRSAGDKVEALRNQANGRFISAAHEGVYKRDGGPAAVRKIALED